MENALRLHLPGQRHVEHLHDEVHIVPALVSFLWQEGVKYVHGVVCRNHDAPNVKGIDEDDDAHCSASHLSCS